ncbi:MAG: hypothetical protein CMH54_09880 [Myxococcales bacterium]|nr:hypothetical protein [Myxococcales bacterium]
MVRHLILLFLVAAFFGCKKQNCRELAACTLQGRCTNGDKTMPCKATSDEDCRRSSRCKSHKNCYHRKDGRCWPTPD